MVGNNQIKVYESLSSGPSVFSKNDKNLTSPLPKAMQGDVVGGSNSVQLSTPPTESRPKILDPNIKATMNIEKVGPNQFRFVDDPDPPDTGKEMVMHKDDKVVSDSVKVVAETRQANDTAMDVLTQ